MVTDDRHAFDIDEHIVFVATDKTRRGSPHFVIPRRNREFIDAIFVSLCCCNRRVGRGFIDAVPEGNGRSGQRLVQGRDVARITLSGKLFCFGGSWPLARDRPATMKTKAMTGYLNLISLLPNGFATPLNFVVMRFYYRQLPVTKPNCSVTLSPIDRRRTGGV